VGFLASFHDPGKIFEQISIIYALPRLFIGSFTLVLPFFPTGTAERVRLERGVYFGAPPPGAPPPPSHLGFSTVCLKACRLD